MTCIVVAYAYDGAAVRPSTCAKHETQTASVWKIYVRVIDPAVFCVAVFRLTSPNGLEIGPLDSQLQSPEPEQETPA